MSAQTRAGDRFATTEWSLVTRAADSRDPQANGALATLCEAYWLPVYAFVRSRGIGPDDARDLTQGFFAVMLEKHYLKEARRERGRFRSFLLAAVKHYLANEWDRGRAIKRGGGAIMLSLDLDSAEHRYRIELRDEDTPERAFERRWALTLVDTVLREIEHEAERGGTLERFRRLRPLLTGTDEPRYRELAQALGMSEGALKVAVHRLRRRFADVLRREVARTVEGSQGIDAEIRHLFDVLRG